MSETGKSELPYMTWDEGYPDALLIPVDNPENPQLDAYNKAHKVLVLMALYRDGTFDKTPTVQVEAESPFFPITQSIIADIRDGTLDAEVWQDVSEALMEGTFARTVWMDYPIRQTGE